MIDSRSVHDLRMETKILWLRVETEMARLGMPVAIVSTFRDFEMQNYLYTQGRTRAGDKITWVRGGGSFHNVRRAIDAWPLNPKTGKLDKKFVDSKAAEPMFIEFGRIGKALGFQWGGDWPKGKTDRPHLQDGWCDRCGIIATTARHFNEDGSCAHGG